jgi:hypothetical protein
MGSHRQAIRMQVVVWEIFKKEVMTLVFTGTRLPEEMPGGEPGMPSVPGREECL